VTPNPLKEGLDGCCLSTRFSSLTGKRGI
jgi:hypothetical protein